MYLVSISDLTPGQVLAKGVTNETGAVLCPPGFKLTDAAIERLKNAGVESVIVEGSDEDGGEAYRNRLDELRVRFEGIDDPIMLQLKAVIEKRLNFMALQTGGES